VVAVALIKVVAEAVKAAVAIRLPVVVRDADAVATRRAAVRVDREAGAVWPTCRKKIARR